jgi:hypothetical protein
MRQRPRSRIGSVLALVTIAVLAAPGSALGAHNSTVSFSFLCSGQRFLNTCPQGSATKGRLAIHTHTTYTNPGNANPGGAAKRIQLFFDNDFSFDPSVTPRCDPANLGGNIDMAQAMMNCGSSLIGTGTAQALETSSITINGCLLLFNATNDANGDPRIAFFARVNTQSPGTIDCSNPASNHQGNVTVMLPATLRTTPVGDYRKEIDLPNISQNTPFPVSDLNFTLQKNTFLSGYAKARCFDANHVWNVTAFFTYNNNTTQTVNATRTCAAVSGG